MIPLLFYILVLFACITKCNSVLVAEQKEQLEHDLTVRAWLDKGAEMSIVLGDSFLSYAHEQNAVLKSADFDCFDPRVLRDKERVSQKIGEYGGKSRYLVFEDLNNNKRNLYCTFFNRHSDTLLVIGTGFPVPCERMLPFVRLFPSYDILFFDYEGTGMHHTHPLSSFYYPWKWKGLVSSKLLNVDCNVSNLGTTEEHDVIGVVNEYKKSTHYTRCFGIGLCFSSYTFAKAAALVPHLFDKLIFDGSWPSLERVAKTIIKNPSLLCSVEKPHSLVSSITHRQWFQNSLFSIVQWLTYTNLKAPPLAFYLSKLRCPVLFIQSEIDCYCDKEEFEWLWNAVSTPKAAVLTKNLHGRNHVWQAEAYKELAHAFFDLSPAKMYAFCCNHTFELNYAQT